MLTIERWLTAHQRLILAAIVLVSVLLRVGYYSEIGQSPGAYQHRWDQSDMHCFNTWAQDIAQGDWLSSNVRPPIHWWHKLLAVQYFRIHPEAVALLKQSKGSEDASFIAIQALWTRWIGSKNLYHEPLYPYLIALTYKAFGTDVRWVFLWQMLVGITSNILIYLIARRHFGVVVAAVTGFLAVLCSPLLYYNMILLRETLLTFMGLGLVCLSDLALARGTWRWWFLTGLACGLAVLLKTTFLLFWLGVLGLSVYHQRATPRVLVRSLAALVCGLVISLTPLMARNIAVGGSPLRLPGVGAITFILSNTENFPPEEGFFIDLKHAPLIMEETGGRFLPALVKTLKTHSTPWDYLKLLWRKFAVMWHWYEIPNNTNFYYYRLHSSVLRFTPFTFWILAPLSMVGLAIAVGRRIPCYPLYLFVLSNMTIMLLFYVISRFRLPLLVALLPFAALAVVQITQWLVNRQVVISMGAITALVLLSLWTMRPLPANIPLIRPADYIMAYSVQYVHLLQEAQERQDWFRLAEILESILRDEPIVVRQMSFVRPPKNQEEARLASHFGLIHQHYARALQLARRPLAAADQSRRAHELEQVSRDNQAR
jgi:4-amino-4-deoxy-L-arabinose transferase-like glycosyltransferase